MMQQTCSPILFFNNTVVRNLIFKFSSSLKDHILKFLKFLYYLGSVLSRHILLILKLKFEPLFSPVKYLADNFPKNSNEYFLSYLILCIENKL